MRRLTQVAVRTQDIQAAMAASFLTALQIDRLVGSNPIQPRTKPARTVEQSCLFMDLQKGQLKRILSQRIVPEVAPQKAVEFVLISLNESFERSRIAAISIGDQQ